VALQIANIMSWMMTKMMSRIQEITMCVISAEIRKRLDEMFRIDYALCLGQNPEFLTPQGLKTQIINKIAFDWMDMYDIQCEMKSSILEITIDGYTFLWDETYERVVVVYGIASDELINKVKQRDRPRIAYYYRNFIKDIENSQYDTGHFIAHSLGGGMDMNLFPQKREMNRGYSESGSVYRKMENYALRHPETLVFSRPIYFDDTWRPFFLEYGVLKDVFELWWNIFDNL
jgi:hypothetical protein